MKKSLIYILLLLILPMGLSAQVTVTGSTGADATYPRLGLAFAAINGTAQTGNNILISITGSTTETAPAVLNAGTWISLRISPTVPGIVISGNLAAPLIDLNGADSVTIDGRVNGVKDMTIDNASTAAIAGTSAIRLRNDAAFNVIKYCILKGSETSPASGIVYFNITTGSDGNLIDNNDITSSTDANRPVNAIYSLGIVTKATSPNKISNNNIFNHLNRAVSSNGIHLGANNSEWIITGNSFYETDPFAPTNLTLITHTAIRINNSISGVNFTVSDNFIGGSAPLCLGTAWTKTNEVNNAFIGIYLNVATSTASNVQNNTIKNIDWSNATSATWTGIQIARGDVNVGTATGNTIGAATGTGSILVTGSNTTGGYNVYGIYIQGPGNADCRNNQIGSITVSNADGFGCNFYGIYKSNSDGNTTISNNTIGSPDEPNSILASSPSTGYPQTVRGIYNLGRGTNVIRDNIIANLNNATTNTDAGTNGRINGIYSSSANETQTISGNIIRDLTISNANSQTNLNASVCGIALNSTSVKNVTGNTIYNLSNTYNSFTGNVYGLFYMGSTNNNTIDGNFIHSLTVPSSAGASISGIRINTGASTYSNNIITLGSNTSTTLYGIYEYGLAGNDNKLYHNTVFIGGSAASGTNRSYALYSAVNTNARDFSNNIFTNARSTAGGTNLHYAVYIASTDGTITCNYNDYWVSGTGGIMGYYGANKTTLPVVTGQDVNSQAADPAFASAGGTSATDYIPGNCSLAAPLIPAVPNDYVPVTRPDPTLMGAYHVTPCLRVEVYKSSVFEAAYPNLKGAFDAFNSGIHKTGSFEIRINGDVFEISSAVLNASGTGDADYSSVIIYPAIPGVKISGSLAAPLIDLNGADNVTIDGRVNVTGSTRDMTITNASNSAIAGTSTIRMINSATNNTVRYCWLRGSETGATSGVLLFSTSAATSGNNGNIIDNNYITNADNSKRPVNAIYSLGTASFENTGNTISNNNIYDCLNPRITSNVICLSTNSTGWTISGNSFYETTSFVPAGNMTYYIIRINNTGGDYSISGNYIGGGTPLCGNPAWIKSNAFNNVFFGIHITAGTGTSNSIQGNTIRNFDWSNSLNGNWTGIHLLRGNADVGTVTGNNIGAAYGTGSILLTSKTTGNNVYGINIATPGTVNCLNNNIGSITIANADADGCNFYGINKSASGGATTISNNNIGSSSTANSISATSPSTGNAQTVHGIFTAGTGLITISGNATGNLNNNTTNAGSVIGISFTGNTGANAVSGNFVHSLSISSSSGLVYGIKTNTGSCTYSNNIITLGGSSPATIYGIYETGVAGNNNKIWFNTVYTGGTPATGTSSSYSFYSAATNTRDIRNNIFVNGRSTSGGTNLHYAAYIASASGTITCDYNNYWVSGEGGTLGYFSGNKTALPIVTGQDVASQAADPLFARTGNVPENYLSGVYFPGVTIPSITTDFGENPRIVPTMGAWEGYINTWKGTISNDWNTGANWATGQVPLPDADIIFDLSPLNNLVMYQDRSVRNITDSSAYSLMTNGYKLTLKGNLFFSSEPRIDATASGSTLEFAGDNAQTIESDRFLDDKANNLIINNVAGVSLNTDFTVDNALTINTGTRLTISAPRLLTVTGTLTNNAGTSGLVIKSTGNGIDGKLINDSPSVNASVELLLSGGTSPTGRRIHAFVPPVQSMTVGADIPAVRSSLNVTYFNGYLLYWDNTKTVTSQSQGWQYFDGYNNTTPLPSNAITSDMGYYFYLSQDDTVTFKGALNGSTNTFNLDYTPGNADPGGNLIGNPYPCNYDLTGVPEFMGPASDNVDNTVYYYTNGQYKVYNVSTGVGDIGYTNIVPPMQGFFINITGPKSLSFPAASKTSSAAGVERSKGAEDSENSQIRKIKMILENDVAYDEAYVCLTDKATSGFDGDYDAYKLFGSSTTTPLIYSNLNAVKYAINTVQEPGSGVIVIPVTVELKASGTYKINFPEFENLDGIRVVLKHGRVETKINKGTIYTFKSDAGTFSNFEIIIGDNTKSAQSERAAVAKFNTWYNDSYLYIKCPEEIQGDKGNLIIYDSQGKVISNNNLTSISPGNTIQIPVNLTRGFYIINIVVGKQPSTSKIVVF